MITFLARSRVLLAAVALAQSSCAAFGYGGLSAEHVGCKAREVVVTDVQPHGSSTSWTATCHGKSYACGGDVEGTVACRENVVGARAPAVSTPPAAPPPVAPPPAPTTGCQYDTQCKGERICVQGACVNPA